jgi:hypothetical protein
MAKIVRKTLCHKCVEEFSKKEFDWVLTKSFKWVPAEQNDDHYYVPMCKPCQNEKV